MKIDNIDYFSSSKLSQIIAERFGCSVNLGELEDNTLQTFKESVRDSIKSFESAMAFNTQATNPKYMENKLLFDAIVKEQEMRIKKVQGDEIEIEDPAKPGVTTKVDTKEVDVDTDNAGNVEIKSKKDSNNNVKQNVKVGQKVTMEDLDDEARNFVDYIQDQGYKIDSMGAGVKGISIQYTTRDGDTHNVDFKDGKVTREDAGDLEDVVAPEFKKLVHDMQKGMSKKELEKKYPKQKDSIAQLEKDLAKVVEAIKQTVTGQVAEQQVRLGAKEMAALRLLVGNQNFSEAKRALELAKSGRSVPAPLMKGFMPIIDKLDTFIKGGASAVTRFNNLQKIVGRNESNDYASSLRSLLENEMETSEILLASQDIVDTITDMYEKIAEIKSSQVLELVDRMSNELGQQQAQSYQDKINPTLEALEEALGTARQGAQDSVSIVKGESVAPMAGDTDIDTSMDMDMDAGGDADIEGGDDFGASEPAAGGDEIAGRAER
tara:strand:- start:10397 stop:11869 length:1473 start_codon:yes stop_codon:yes gene_type:complete